MKKYVLMPIEKIINRLNKAKRESFLVLLFISSCCCVNAQSVNVGLTGSFGDVSFINKNFSSATAQTSTFKPSYNGGLLFAINYKNGLSLELDILKGTMNEGFQGAFSTSGSFIVGNSSISYSPNQSYTSKIALGVTQLPFMIRYKSKPTSVYIEAGMEYDGISSATYSATYSNPSYSATQNAIIAYAQGAFAALAGLGWDKELRKESYFYLDMGVRIAYGLTDLQGVDGHGQNIGDQALYKTNNTSYIPYYLASGYQTTHTLELSAHLGIFYKFPRKQKSNIEVDF